MNCKRAVRELADGFFLLHNYGEEGDGKMNGFNNPFLNPYGFGQQQYMQQVPGTGFQAAPAPVQVIRVNGENGARAFQIGPNSSALLLDESGTMVWLVTSDGAGYRTVSAYDIAPHKDAPEQDFSDLEGRVRKLEEMIGGGAGGGQKNEHPGNSGNSAAAGRKPSGAG